MKLKKICRILIILCILLILIDQISKLLINNYLDDKIVLIENVLSIVKVENTGIAFGLNKQNFANIILCLVIMGAIINYIINQKDRLNKVIVISLGMILAGGISNVIDRIIKGAVFDFIKVGNWFPVFNFADCFIVIGWFVFVITFIINSTKDIKITLVDEDDLKSGKKSNKNSRNSNR